MLSAAWAGIDAGKSHHHVVVIDGEGRRLLSQRVPNDEAELTELVDDALQLAETLTWAIDLADGGAALMITLLDRGPLTRVFQWTGLDGVIALYPTLGEAIAPNPAAAGAADEGQVPPDA